MIRIDVDTPVGSNFITKHYLCIEVDVTRIKTISVITILAFTNFFPPKDQQLLQDQQF